MRTAASALAPATAAVSWPLWSTEARLVVDEPDELMAAAAIADRVLGEIDAASSRFRFDSELSRAAARLPKGAEVSATLALLVRRALEAAALTDGSVDPTLGYAMDAVGYDRDIRFIEEDGRPVRAIVSPRPGWRSVTLEGRELRVPAHLALDLGATAKAVAADLTAARIAEELGCGVLISLGGDIATARGPAGRAPAEGWRIHVQDLPDDPSCEVMLDPGSAMATSSTQKRRWRKAGERMHHILDPRTGRPADAVWRSVTVAATSCWAANTLTTAAIVRGAEAPEWLTAIGAPARLVAHDGAVLTLAGWPDPVPSE
jgi:thiamine biosynthesis lipoprotein